MKLWSTLVLDQRGHCLSKMKYWNTATFRTDAVVVLIDIPFTQGLRPLCLPCTTTKLTRSPLKAQRRQEGCLGRSRVAQRMIRTRHGRQGRREVLRMFKTIIRSSRRLALTGRSREAAGRYTHRRGRRMDAHGSAIGRPVENAYCCKHYINLSDASASFAPQMCLLCPINSVHRGINVATTVPPFGDHDNPWATRQWFCLHSASFVRPVVLLQLF